MSTQAPSQSENQQNTNSSSDDMAQLYQEVIKKRSLIIVEDNQLLPLLDYCLDYKQQCLEDEKYLLARDANELAESIKEELQYREEDQSSSQTVATEESTETTKKISEYVFILQKKKKLMRCRYFFLFYPILIRFQSFHYLD